MRTIHFLSLAKLETLIAKISSRMVEPEKRTRRRKAYLAKAYKIWNQRLLDLSIDVDANGMPVSLRESHKLIEEHHAA